MVRQERKFLPFLKLQPPQISEGFYIPSHPLGFSIRCVLGILVTNFPHPKPGSSFSYRPKDDPGSIGSYTFPSIA